MEVIAHKFIILGSYSANTLGQIRSRGEKGIKPIGVLVHKNTFRIDKSKYLEKVFCVNTAEEGLDLIIRIFGHEDKKPFLYTDMDYVMALIDQRLDEIKNCFYVWNAGESGIITKILNKFEQFKLAKNAVLQYPKRSM